MSASVRGFICTVDDFVHAEKEVRNQFIYSYCGRDAWMAKARRFDVFRVLAGLKLCRPCADAVERSHARASTESATRRRKRA